MSVFEVRVSFTLFIGIAIIICANALFFQPSIGHGFQNTLKVTPPIFTDKAMVKAIQLELLSRNYSPGNANGRLSLQTSAAILAYEQDHELPLTARESSSLLKHMLLAQYDAATSTRNSSYVLRLQKAVAHVLRNLENGTPMDSTSRIRYFERKWSLPITGRISGRLIRKIGRVTGEKVS